MHTIDSVDNEAQAILEYWFSTPASPYVPQINAELWFQKSDATDRFIRDRFSSVVERAHAGELSSWKEPPRQRLALIIVLDQFSRNIFRGTPRSFAGDERALALAQETVATGGDRSVTAIERVFFYMPFEHAEDLDCQDTAVAKFKELESEAGPDQAKTFSTFVDFAERHRDVIRRFGRFPHRNEILGRASTEEETQFLQKPGSRF